MHWSTPLLILSAAALASACVMMGHVYGRLPDAVLLQPQFGVASSCSCCAACHHRADCASLSFNSSDDSCRLYSSTGHYGMFFSNHKKKESKFFLMPGKSGHGEFCVKDGDCTEPEDRCRGRQCTTKGTISCKDTKGQYGANMTQVPRFYIAIDNETALVHCWDEWTQIFSWGENNDAWPHPYVQYKNSLSSKHFSLLRLADKLVAASGAANYQIKVIWRQATNIKASVIGTVPASVSLVGDTPQPPGVMQIDSVTKWLNSACAQDQLTVPWLPGDGKTLLTANVNGDPASCGVLASQDKNIIWLDNYTDLGINVRYFIKE